MKKEIKCPSCGASTFYPPENPYRPFCSERCRVIDLGQWASENYRIPTPITPETANEALESLEKTLIDEKENN